MKWTSEAEAEVKKVPFFVRKKVRARVENEAVAVGKKVVSLEDVKSSQARFLSKMSSEVKGYQVDTCFGPSGCPNRANNGERLIQKIETFFEKEDLLGFLKKRVKDDIKFHHEFRVTLAECPNACSQPQIKDIGIIGAVVPVITDETCTLCDACAENCPEKCITLNDSTQMPEVDFETCLTCGRCINACPSGTIKVETKGFRFEILNDLKRSLHLLAYNKLYCYTQNLNLSKGKS